jgi:ribosome-associated translation inhibitor RaiA
MMSVQFIAHDLEWTESMKNCVRQRIAAPLSKHIAGEDFQISIFLRQAHKPGGTRYSMTVVLNSERHRNLKMIGREGEDFFDLTNKISSGMRTELKKKNLRSRRLS